MVLNLFYITNLYSLNMAKFISIKLLNAQPVWNPGDTILGEVHFTCMEQVDIQSVSVLFQGKAKAKFRRSNGQSTSTFKSKMRLFHSNEILFRGPFTLPKGAMKWPFEFPIPTTCRWATGEGFNQNALFDTSRDQPLPPSFSSSGFTNHKECQVEYALTAVMQTSRTFATNRDFVLPITIIPPRIHEPSQFRPLKLPKAFFVQTLHLDPEVNDRSLTFKEKMRTAFRSETLPRTNFKIQLELPGAALAHGPVNPIMYLEHNLDRSTATEIPIVNLVAFTLNLKHDVVIRTSGLMHDRLQDWSDSRLICNWIGRIPLSERLEVLKSIRPGTVLPPNVTPSFSTHNIVLGYRWKAKYTIECATKRFDAEATGPCAVLGPQNDTPTAILPGLPTSVAQIPIEEEQLPAYSEEGEAIPV